MKNKYNIGDKVNFVYYSNDLEEGIISGFSVKGIFKKRIVYTIIFERSYGKRCRDISENKLLKLNPIK
jgi:hypothetical protein